MVTPTGASASPRPPEPRRRPPKSLRMQEAFAKGVLGGGAASSPKPLRARVTVGGRPLPPRISVGALAAPPRLDLSMPPGGEPKATGVGYLAPHGEGDTDQGARVLEGLASGEYHYEFVGEGVTGSRKLVDESGVTVAIIKFPQDEPGGPTAINPVLICPRSKQGIRPGHGVLGDPIAHALFPDMVPASHLIKLNHPTTGESTLAMMQTWIPDATCLESLSLEERDRIPDEQFELLAMIDLSLANTDRNMGNVLKAPDGRLYAIDNSLIAPQGFASEVRPSWWFWPQANHPFKSAAKDKILSLDENKIVVMVQGKSPDFPPERLRSLALSVILLKECVKHGITVQQSARLLAKVGGEDWGDVSPASVFLKEAGFGADTKCIDLDPVTHEELAWVDGKAFHLEQLDALREVAKRRVLEYVPLAADDQRALDACDGVRAKIKLEMTMDLPSHQWIRKLASE